MIVLVPVVWEKDTKREERLTVLCFIPLTIDFIPFHSTFQSSSRPSFLFLFACLWSKMSALEKGSGMGGGGEWEPVGGRLGAYI